MNKSIRTIFDVRGETGKSFLQVSFISFDKEICTLNLTIRYFAIKNKINILQLIYFLCIIIYTQFIYYLLNFICIMYIFLFPYKMSGEYSREF